MSEIVIFEKGAFLSVILYLNSIFCLIILLFSNVIQNFVSLIVFIFLQFKKKDKIPYGCFCLMAISIQVALVLIAALMQKYQILWWQGFLDGTFFFEVLKKTQLMNFPLCFLVPLFLGLIFIPKQPLLALYFFLCATFSQVYFLPIVGILIILKIKPFVMVLVLLWLVENYLCTEYLLVIPPCVQWIDLIVVAVLIPIAIVKMDIPHRFFSLGTKIWKK